MLLRPAVSEDADILLSWVNSSESLKWKQNTNSPISPSQHDKWLRNRLLDSNTQIWIVLQGALPVGQVRLERQSDIVYTDIYIDWGARGQGIASAALECAIAKYKSAHGNHVFCAIVHVENKSSQKLFIKSRFNPIESGDADWLKYIRSEE